MVPDVLADLRTQIRNCGFEISPLTEAMENAAAEIERLRAELKELEQQDADVTNMLVGENRRLHVYLYDQAAEIERLRARVGG